MVCGHNQARVLNLVPRGHLARLAPNLDRTLAPNLDRTRALIRVPIQSRALTRSRVLIPRRAHRCGLVNRAMPLATDFSLKIGIGPMRVGMLSESANGDRPTAVASMPAATKT